MCTLSEKIRMRSPSVGVALCWPWQWDARVYRPPCCLWRVRPPSPAGHSPAPATRTAAAGSSPPRTRRYRTSYEDGKFSDLSPFLIEQGPGFDSATIKRSNRI